MGTGCHMQGSTTLYLFICTFTFTFICKCTNVHITVCLNVEIILVHTVLYNNFSFTF